MIKNRLFGAACAATFVLASGTAAAVPLYVQPGTGDVAVQSSLDGAQNADNFSLSQAALIDSVEWWGTSADGALDGFTVRIFGDDAGQPGLDPLHTLTGMVTATLDPSGNLPGMDVYAYRLAMTTSLELAPAAAYYLAVSNESLADGWYWLLSGVFDSASFFRAADGDPWDPPYSDDFAFAIGGVFKEPPVGVPEPGTSALLSIGLAALLLRSRRRLAVEDSNTRS